jgi:hypothetical protein
MKQQTKYSRLHGIQSAAGSGSQTSAAAVRNFSTLKQECHHFDIYLFEYFLVGEPVPLF